jgi:hypothetical protein
MKFAILVARPVFGVWFIMSGLHGISPDMPMGADRKFKLPLQRSYFADRALCCDQTCHRQPKARQLGGSTASLRPSCP